MIVYVGWLLIIMGFIICMFAIEGMVPGFAVLGAIICIGGTLMVSMGVKENITASMEEVKQKQVEMYAKLEEFEGKIKLAVIEETGSFDTEIVSENTGENYYNVRSNTDLYRVYYKNWEIKGIEQNDKFIYTEDKKKEVEEVIEDK